VLGDRLDGRLAEGARPEGDVLLAMRAQQLACGRSRRELATTVRRLLDASDVSTNGYNPAGTLAVLSRVVTAREDFECLIAHLLAPAPVSARGVATVRLLLRDGTGPLYRYESRADLKAMVRASIAALDPQRDWPG
jgi:hypothetical protein